MIFNIIYVHLCKMFEYDWEKIGSVVSKYSANLMASAEDPQKLAESGLQGLSLFGCMVCKILC